VIAGDFQDETIFTGLVQAMVTYKDREKHGASMRGFKYAPNVTEFAHIINIHGPRAYQALRSVLQLPTELNSQYVFLFIQLAPVSSTARSIALDNHDSQLEYSGTRFPESSIISTGSNITGRFHWRAMIHSSLQHYVHTTALQNYYLLGGTGEPILLLEPDKVADVIRQGRFEKATKVRGSVDSLRIAHSYGPFQLRLWCIQVPLPGIPTIIAAAHAIPDNVTVDQLFEYNRILLDGLLAHNLNIVSYSVDGSSVEWSLEHLIESSAPSKRIIVFKHPV
jgi:hypothetical protein